MAEKAGLAIFGEKRNGLLGLDIGSASIKLLELSWSGGNYRLESYAVQPLQPDAVVERNISDVGEVVEALKGAHGRLRSRIRRAAVALAGSSVIARTISMEASLSDSEFAERIAAGGERYLPYPIADLAVDFEVLGLSESNPEQVELLLVACRKSAVQRIGEALAGADLKPGVIEPEYQSVERAFELLRPAGEGQAGELVVAVADIGAAATTLSVLVDGRSVFTRDQPFGGRNLTEAIARQYSLPFQEAEIAKIRGDLPGGFAEDVLQPFNESAVQQLSRVLRFFHSSTHYNDIDQILLMGGGACTLGLADGLGSALGVPVAVADPFARMSLAPGVNAAALAEDACALSKSLGLAMRGLE